jgi:hypothetical protein
MLGKYAILIIQQTNSHNLSGKISLNVIIAFLPKAPIVNSIRFINKILYKTILGKVNVEIERIEKDKLSHNYEGIFTEIL